MGKRIEKILRELFSQQEITEEHVRNLNFYIIAAHSVIFIGFSDWWGKCDIVKKSAFVQRLTVRLEEYKSRKEGDSGIHFLLWSGTCWDSHERNFEDSDHFDLLFLMTANLVFGKKKVVSTYQLPINEV